VESLNPYEASEVRGICCENMLTGRRQWAEMTIVWPC
jgi:hypothetical protein